MPQPQTREHLLALSVLGIQQIVLVQNKADLAEYQEALDNYNQIKDFVNGSIAEKAPIIPVSAQHKLNIDALIEAIEKTIKTPARIKNAEPIMHVLRSFDVNKPGSPINQIKGGIIGGGAGTGSV